MTSESPLILHFFADRQDFILISDVIHEENLRYVSSQSPECFLSIVKSLKPTHIISSLECFNRHLLNDLKEYKLLDLQCLLAVVDDQVEINSKSINLYADAVLQKTKDNIRQFCLNASNLQISKEKQDLLFAKIQEMQSEYLMSVVNKAFKNLHYLSHFKSFDTYSEMNSIIHRHWHSMAGTARTFNLVDAEEALSFLEQDSEEIEKLLELLAHKTAVHYQSALHFTRHMSNKLLDR